MKAISALSITLVFLLFILIYFLLNPPMAKNQVKPFEFEREKPTNKSQHFNSIVQVNSPKRIVRTQKQDKKKVGKHTTPKVDLPNRVFSLDFRAKIYTEAGKPVQGAWMFATKIDYSIEGDPIPHSLSFRPYDKRHPQRQSNSNGLINCTAFYKSDTDIEEIYEVFAYKPELGLGFREFTFQELSECQSEDLAITLEQGKSITGQIVNKNGQPLKEVFVDVCMHSKSGVQLSGLCAMTGEDGKFLMRGVILQNTPISVHARYSTLRREPADPTQPSDINNLPVKKGICVTNQKGISKKNFNPSSNTWEIGTITLSLGKRNTFNKEH